MNPTTKAAVIEALEKAQALADKSDKLDRSRLLGNATIKHYDTIIAALRPEPEPTPEPVAENRHEIAQENERQYLKGFQAGKEFALEEAAKACTTEANFVKSDKDGGFSTAMNCAAAIRAMKGKP